MKTSKFTMANVSTLFSNNFRSFSTQHLNDGTPCIVGDLKVSDTATSVIVFSAGGGRAKMHNIPSHNKVLYEVKPGDFIAVYERGGKLAELQIYSRYISEITDNNVITLPAVL